MVGVERERRREEEERRSLIVKKLKSSLSRESKSHEMSRKSPKREVEIQYRRVQMQPSTYTP